MWKSNSTYFHTGFSTSQPKNVEKCVENVNYFDFLYTFYNKVTEFSTLNAISNK